MPCSPGGVCTTRGIARRRSTLPSWQPKLSLTASPCLPRALLIASSASPRPGARTPTRKTTPLSSRTGSPNPASRLHLPLVAGALFASGPGSVPPSPTNLHSSSVHSREEDSTSASACLFASRKLAEPKLIRFSPALLFSQVFERDIEHAITSSPAMLPSTPSNAGNISPSPSSTFPQLTPTKSAVSSHSHHLHHPQARASVTDSLFPTVLDDAVEALSSGSDVLVVSPSRTGSPTSLSVRKPYSPSAGMVGSRETSPGSPGTRSPVRAGSVGGVMLSERERRSSAISLTGQAGKMLDSAAEPSQGFRLTLPGDDVSRVSRCSSQSRTDDEILCSTRPSCPRRHLPLLDCRLLQSRRATSRPFRFIPRARASLVIQLHTVSPSSHHKVRLSLCFLFWLWLEPLH